MTSPALVALDWGTTSFRAYLIDDGGQILARRAAKAGILQVEGGRFAEVLEQETSAWFAAHGELPLITSGMIGSRQGWIETPYLACPASLDGLAAKLVAHPTGTGRVLHVVPGLSVDGPLPDVMRGEETELVGLGAMSGDALYVLPGTHSKWVRATGGRIESFTTFMTGEVFAVLKEHSILGRLMTGDLDDSAAFNRGVGVALDGEAATGGLLHTLFTARTLPLLGRLPGDQVASYLSGLLIGAEVKAATVGAAELPVVLVGSGPLSERYKVALARGGRQATMAPADAAARGLFTIAGAAGLL
jgi:2-dehydro-3-deoxygalactonokinase